MSTLARIVALCAAVLAPAYASAQQYPSKPVKVVIPFSAGGVTDIAGRLIGQKLSERMGQQFYIENVGGAGGNIGMGQAARAAGDGYTLLFSSSSFVVNPSLYSKPTFDPAKDFIPITKIGGSPNGWVVNADLPAKTMKELVDLLKNNPGKYSVGSPGMGTTPSLAIELLRMTMKLDYVVVPFAGGGPMTQALLGGHVPIAVSTVGNLAGLLKDGKVRALAVAADKRLAAIPDTPTMTEAGITEQDSETMTGAFAPAGTPQAIVDALQKEIAAIVRTPEVNARLIELGVIPSGNTSKEFDAYIQAEIARWKKVIEGANISKI
jgi:tripartite-type tricarboxylate transporter receptor subunit TctC